MRNTNATIFEPAELTATTTGDSVDLSAWHGMADIILASSATGGEGQTAVVTIEHSDDDDVFASAGITFGTIDHTEGVTQTARVNIDQLKQYVRAKVTLAGDTPAVTCAVLVSGPRNYA